MASESKPTMAAVHVTLSWCHWCDTYWKTRYQYPLNPYPRVQVQVSWGTGTGSLGKPQGYLWQSLTAEDLGWWRIRLQEGFVGLKIIQPPKPLPNKVYIDASTSWGIGLVIDGKWLAWQFKGLKSEGREIGWAEMVAVELDILTLITGNFRVVT